MHTVFLGLGSNTGDRAANLERALALLRSAGVSIPRVSSLWETEPQELVHQPWFLNMVVEGETTLFPRQLLQLIHRIERGLGRRRIVPKGPRVIDIDILLFGNSRMKVAELEIPHPAMAQRRFVLAPLAELAPDLKHPVTHETVREMLSRVLDQGARRFAAK